MKRVYLFISVLVLSLLWSCTKGQIDNPAESHVEPLGPIKLNITVSAPGEDTKAAKTAWMSGDKINLWFDGSGANQTLPDLVVTYDGESWAAGTLRDGCSLESSGQLLALYEAYNDISADRYSYNWDSSKEWFYPTPSKVSSDYRCMPMVFHCESIPYTFNDLTLTAHFVLQKVAF